MGQEIQKMDEARSPAPPDKDQKLREVIASYLIEGYSPGQIAKAFHGNDKKAKKRMRAKVRKLLANDPKLAEEVGKRGMAKLTARLGPVLDGLIGKAETGNPIAAKLVLEASGFHNPRTQHEHSGEVKITMSIPRPAAPEQKTIDIPDADVVEEPPTG